MSKNKTVKKGMYRLSMGKLPELKRASPILPEKQKTSSENVPSVKISKPLDSSSRHEHGDQIHHTHHEHGHSKHNHNVGHHSGIQHKSHHEHSKHNHNVGKEHHSHHENLKHHHSVGHTSGNEHHHLTHHSVKEHHNHHLPSVHKMNSGTQGVIENNSKGIEGSLMEKYEINVDGARVQIEIRKGRMGLMYNIFIPKINAATSALLDSIRNELISITSVSMKELVDPTAFLSIKDRFLKEAVKLIGQNLPKIDKDVENFLVGHLIQDMLGLGDIEFLINDPTLEEIVIPSSKESIRVYSKKYGWLETNIKINQEELIINYSNIIARRVGRQITVLNPLLDAHLITGDRINAVLYPVNTKGNTITIRKFARDPYTIIDMITSKTCDLDIAALLWLAIEYEMNVLISGGTGSGKTSFLNACMPFIPPNQRIISIEDTRELMLPEFLYTVSY